MTSRGFGPGPKTLSKNTCLGLRITFPFHPSSRTCGTLSSGRSTRDPAGLVVLHPREVIETSSREEVRVKSTQREKCSPSFCFPSQRPCLFLVFSRNLPPGRSLSCLQNQNRNRAIASKTEDSAVDYEPGKAVRAGVRHCLAPKQVANPPNAWGVANP